jgi:6-pyruvoyltetrahydropterin/6-carboxytetrahydropterin synthase
MRLTVKTTDLALNPARASRDMLATEDRIEARPIAYLTRAVDISAAHRLASPALSETENRALYGKCANPNGHGHNYRIEITVRGEVDARTGTVIDLCALDRAIDERIVERLDHRHLDLDVPEFRGRVSTGETIAIVIWELLAPALPPGSLDCVRIEETANNAFEYRGGRS